jgi:hypothetical protein
MTYSSKQLRFWGDPGLLCFGAADLKTGHPVGDRPVTRRAYCTRRDPYAKDVLTELAQEFLQAARETEECGDLENGKASRG